MTKRTTKSDNTDATHTLSLSQTHTLSLSLTHTHTHTQVRQAEHCSTVERAQNCVCVFGLEFSSL